jgi:NAD(P)-dependent dehydrogenase (short-subunit alcohol dehydrogenase family)
MSPMEPASTRCIRASFTRPLPTHRARELNEVVIASTPMKRGGKPIEVAYGCLFLASDEASYVTGAELVIDGGYLAQ